MEPYIVNILCTLQMSAEYTVDNINTSQQSRTQAVQL